MSYVGRFAPSPTGPLHFGSLLAALASFLDARAQNGQWLVRIEDLDPPREQPGASDDILCTLEAYHLTWDGTVLYQSQRGDRYDAALEQLAHQGNAFPCACSRKQLQGLPHQVRCPTPVNPDHAWRFLCPAGELTLHDGLQADHHYDLAEDIGDFVIRRRDRLWSYQLAVVVDDEDQGITHVVRGIDLIDSTARQHLLQQALGYHIPAYTHLPVATEVNGQKLSKQNLALPLISDSHTDDTEIVATLWQALHWLRQCPPEALKHESIDGLLDWATHHWQPEVLREITEQPAPVAFQRA